MRSPLLLVVCAYLLGALAGVAAALHLGLWLTGVAIVGMLGVGAWSSYFRSST